MSHGAGGKASHTPVTALFCHVFGNPVLDELGDQAVLAIPGNDSTGLAVTTDSFVVSPLFFPGGDIGELAVNGTVNDLAVGGAAPLGLAAAFILAPVAYIQAGHAKVVDKDDVIRARSESADAQVGTRS